MSPEDLTTRARILIVDDTPVNVRLLERMLASGGFADIRSTTDPRQTLALIDEFQPDLLLLDLNMPHLNGFTILMLVRQRYEENSGPLVIMVTGDATESTTKRALACGATHVITKPFERTELLDQIRKLLSATPARVQS